MLKGVVNPIPPVDGVTDGYVPTASSGQIVWAAQTGGGGGSGTVTSVALSVPTGLSVSGSPITTSGTLAVSLTSGYVIPQQSALDAKLDANTPITGATKTKVTYDADGLVTAGADATTADIADSTDKRYVTDAQLTVIGNTSGTNTGDVSVTDSSEIDFTLTGQNITASIIAGSIDETKLDASVNASLDLADSALQSESDTLQTVTDRGATTTNTVTLSPSGNNKALIANGSGTGAAIDITHSGSGTKLNIGATGSGDLIDAGSGLFKVTSGGSISASGLTASTILSADGSKNIVSLSTATYPSLTELSYLKGATSAIQTQLNTKITASSTDTLTNKTIDANGTGNSITNLETADFAANVIDTDVTLAADSDTRLATQKAVKAYADGLIAAANATIYKGATDCSTNPNYPAADAGWLYRVSVGGKIGGASGTDVQAGDMFICTTDSTASGDQATVGANWNVIQANIDGAVVGPSSATDGNIVLFDGTTGKLIKNSSYSPSSFATSSQGSLADSAVQPGDNVSDLTNDANYITSAGAPVQSVNSQTGTVVLDADDIDDTSTTNKFVTASDLTNLSNLSGTNTGDQDLSSYATTAAVAAGYQPLATVLTNTTASFTTTLETKLNNIEANADVTDAANVTAAGALMDSEVTNLAAVKAFDPTDYQAADSDLTALANNSSNGLWARTGSGTGSARTITGGGGISVTDGDGVSGNPTLGISAKQSIWIPATAMYPASVTPCADLATTSMGAAKPSLKTLDFDSSTQEYCEFAIAFPKGWDEGTITMQYYWSHPSTTTNFGVAWGLQGRAFSDGDDLNTSWVAGTVVTDTGGNTNYQYITAESGTLTLDGSPAAGDLCCFRIYRHVTNAGDTLAVDARLHGMKIFYNINTLDDT